MLRASRPTSRDAACSGSTRRRRPPSKNPPLPRTESTHGVGSGLATTSAACLTTRRRSRLRTAGCLPGFTSRPQKAIVRCGAVTSSEVRGERASGAWTPRPASRCCGVPRGGARAPARGRGAPSTYRGRAAFDNRRSPPAQQPDLRLPVSQRPPVQPRATRRARGWAAERRRPRRTRSPTRARPSSRPSRSPPPPRSTPAERGRPAPGKGEMSQQGAKALAPRWYFTMVAARPPA